MKKSKCKLFSILVIAAMLFTGCSSQGTAVSSGAKPSQAASGASAEREKDSDITVAISSDLVTLDPADTTNTLDGGVQRMIMDGLFGFDKDMKVINMLASGYKANDKATEFTITLLPTGKRGMPPRPRRTLTSWPTRRWASRETACFP